MEERDDGVASKNGTGNLDEKKLQYQNLLNSVLEAKDPDHIPSLLAKDLDFLLSLSQKEGINLSNSIVDEVRSAGDETKATHLEQAIELTFSFMEDFVTETSKIDTQHKKFLGKILRIVSSKEFTAREREDDLDKLFTMERESLTAGFLRHIENECDRISNAPKMTPESGRLLEMLRIIQARVVEELGEDLGEAAQVLGQLIGYDTKAERLAVLEAGLTVRGVNFAHELKKLTNEALEGFEKVTKPVDPGLVLIVKELDDNLQNYIDENSEFE